MRRSELKNWLAVLGIGGGMAIAGGDSPAAAAPTALPDGAEEPREVREREELYVVINHEEQYSVWPVDREVPKGFRTVTLRGEKETCELKACAERIERHDRRDG